MPRETPFEEDNAVCQMAERFGLELSRYETIEIYDEAAIHQAGLMRETPDYSKIRRALAAGAFVQGARRGAVQYTLKKREASASPVHKGGQS